MNYILAFATSIYGEESQCGKIENHISLTSIGALYQNPMNFSPTCNFLGCDTTHIKKCIQTLKKLNISENTIKQSCRANRGGDKIGISSNNHVQELNVPYAPYTKFYEKYLSKIRCKRNLRVLEIGIWEGASLAIFSDYFMGVGAKIIGADIYTEKFIQNKPILEAKNAFRKKNVNVVRADSVKTCKETPFCLKNVLKQFSPFDIIIDDGCHTIDCITSTYNNVKTLIAKHGMYFVEDNFDSQNKMITITNGTLTYIDGFTHDNVGGVYLLEK